MRIGSLCTGYGGFDQACETFFGATTAWVSDIDKGACKILAHRYPGVPNIGDLTTVDWASLEPVDIVTAGYPCQPFSHAGQRGGTDDARHIWPHIAEGLASLRPKYGIFENVRGHLSLGFDQVLRDLAILGYDTRWHILRAADVGAPHARSRIFIFATDRSTVSSTPRRRVVRTGGLPVWADPVQQSDPGFRSGGGGTDVRDPDGFVYDADLVLVAADADSLGRERVGNAWDGWTGPSHSPHSAADASWNERGQRPRLSGVMDGEAGSSSGSGNQRERDRDAAGDSGAAAADSNSERLRGPSVVRGAGSLGSVDGSPCGEARQPKRAREVSGGRSSSAVNWGAYEPAIRRWEAVLGRVAPAPTETSLRGSQRLSPAFVEFMMGLPEGWVTEVPGLSRNEQLKALGNGVVPQQAYAALCHLAAVQQVAA